jgi:Fe-Mn family superoxide dismutase
MEPYIDAETMTLHHDKHHAAYVNNLNKAIAPYPDLQKKSLEELLSNLDAVPAEIRTTVRNNAGGHANHSHLWKTLANPGKKPEGKLAKEIDETFGSYDKWKEEMTKCAMGIFGSGWTWFARGKDGKLFIKPYPNQDSPLMEGATLIYGIDVWEHAYYLKHQNRRADYVKACLVVVNSPKL